MDGNTLGHFLYYHAYQIPYYLINAIALGMQKLEENKVAAELEKKQKRVFEIIKDYIKSDLLQRTWNTDGIIVIYIYLNN